MNERAQSIGVATPIPRRAFTASAGAAVLGISSIRPARAATPTVLRVGHFPNITHVQALVARNLSRQGHGWFEERLGENTRIEWYAYNAGPSAMEAIFAGSIDLTYVGPSPAINAYSRSRGEEVRIVSGAVNGGSALVVQPDSGLRTAADFRGKRIATPQLGNTQDVSARSWLTAGGLKIVLTGGDAQVVPTENPDQISLFQSKQLDAVWTVEPWVSRLEAAGGRVLVDERDAVTTVLVSSAAFLAGQRETARRFVRAHVELTAWIKANPDKAKAKAMVRDELTALTRYELAPELIARAWSRIEVTTDVSRDALDHFVASAKAAGFLRSTPDLARLLATP